MIEAEEAVAALVERLFGQLPVLYTDEETLVTEVSVYLPRRSCCSAARIHQLRDGLRRLRAEGMTVGRGAIRVRALLARDWAESWKRHFKPIEIGRELLIKPSWSKRKPVEGQAVVILDPGLSFGTGQHPTTAFCLAQLVACRRAGLWGPRLSLLDIGCGSGILAIAAARLGYAPVLGVDFDPDAVRIAKSNAEQNGVSQIARFEQTNLTRMPARGHTQYDVVCANLMHDLLIAEVHRICNRLKPHGQLVLAGILCSQFAAVQSTYENAGLKLVRTQADREWQSGMFLGHG